jgi:hypothetical protein
MGIRSRVSSNGSIPEESFTPSRKSAQHLTLPSFNLTSVPDKKKLSASQLSNNVAFVSLGSAEEELWACESVNPCQMPLRPVGMGSSTQARESRRDFENEEVVNIAAKILNVFSKAEHISPRSQGSLWDKITGKN